MNVYVSDGISKECRKRGALILDMAVGGGVRKKKFTLKWSVSYPGKDC